MAADDERAIRGFPVAFRKARATARGRFASVFPPAPPPPRLFTLEKGK